MLKFLRNKKNAKKIWIGLAIIIVPAFAFWGFGSSLRGKSEPGSFGRLNGREIPAIEFQDAVAAVINQAKIQFGDKFEEIQKYLNLQNQALERLILLDEAKRRRISASDKEVIELIEGYPFFQGKKGFDNRVYNDMLHYFLRTQPRIFEEQTRENIMIAKLYKEVTNKVDVNPDEVKFEYRKANEQISVSYLSANPAEFAKSISPSEQELQNYYNKNSAGFKRPLSYNLEYITADSEDKLTGLKEKAGTDMKETGLFPQTGPVPGMGWPPEILKTLAELKVGQYSRPIKIDNNFYLLRLKEKKEPYIPQFSEIKDEVKNSYIKELSETAAKEKIVAAEKQLQSDFKTNPKSVDLPKTAKQFGLGYQTTSPFIFGTYIEGIGASDPLWLSADKLSPDAVSEVISMPSGYYIIRLKTASGIDEKKYESEKEDFRSRILDQKKQETFVKFLEGLKSKAL